LRESTPLPNTGFPVLFICGTGTNTHVYEKKRKIWELEVDHRLTTDRQMDLSGLGIGVKLKERKKDSGPG
jgi:hypothetical protein